MPNNTTQRPERKPFIPHHKHKLSAAQRTQAAFSQLSTVLKKEWSSIRALNMGVKSGTGVIDDVLITQLHHLASAVHMLAVTDAEASRVLVSQCHNLSTQQFQNLQVLLDMLGLEELSDYLRLMCCHLKNHRPTDSMRHTTSTASSASQAISKRPSSSTTATAERPPSTTKSQGKWRLAIASATGSLKQAASPGRVAAEPNGKGSTATSPSDSLTSRQRRMRAAAGVFELSQASFADPDSFQADDRDKQHQQQSGMSGSLLPDPSLLGLRFAHLLPPGHILVKTAESLKQQQEFQAALAKATPRQARTLQRTEVPPLTLPCIVGSTGLSHLAGYNHTHPLDYLGASGTGAWQQGADALSTAGSCSNGSRYQVQQVPADNQHQVTGPWRGSLLDSVPGVQLQADAVQQPGAFFLSTYGGGNAQGQLQNSIGQMRLQQQHLLAQQRQMFRAPHVSIEKLWKTGRAATTAAVLEAARLPVRESPGDATSLLLSAGLVAQRQLLPSRESQSSRPAIATAASVSSPGATRNRRASAAGWRAGTVISRPSTAAAATSRPSSAVPTLQLHKLDTAAHDRDGGDGGSTCRPESAAASSRLGPSRPAGSTGASEPC